MDILHSIYDCTIFAIVAIIGYENENRNETQECENYE